jgi:hypothetical protein
MYQAFPQTASVNSILPQLPAILLHFKVWRTTPWLSILTYSLLIKNILDYRGPFSADENLSYYSIDTIDTIDHPLARTLPPKDAHKCNVFS